MIGQNALNKLLVNYVAFPRNHKSADFVMKTALSFIFFGKIALTQTAHFPPDPNADPNAEMSGKRRMKTSGGFWREKSYIHIFLRGRNIFRPHFLMFLVVVHLWSAAQSVQDVFSKGFILCIAM